MSISPAQIGRYSDHGQPIAAGSTANLTFIDPRAIWKVDRDLVASRSKNTPFHGMELPGKVVATFFRGEPTVLNGELVRSSGGS